jgi:hypothetical protein
VALASAFVPQVNAAWLCNFIIDALLFSQSSRRWCSTRNQLQPAAFDTGRTAARSSLPSRATRHALPQCKLSCTLSGHLAPCTLLFAAAPPPPTAISLRRRHRRARRTGSLGIIQATRSGAFTNHSAPLETAESHPPWLPKTPSPPLASVAGVRPLRSTRPICILTTPPSPATGSQTPPAALTRASYLPSPAPPPSRCPDRPHPAPAAGPVPA